MRVRSIDDLVYWLLARLPLLLIVGGFAWLMISGLQYVDNVLVSRDAAIATGAQVVSDEQILLDALNSGDTTRMAAALEQVEERQARRAPAAQY